MNGLTKLLANSAIGLLLCACSVGYGAPVYQDDLSSTESPFETVASEDLVTAFIGKAVIEIADSRFPGPFRQSLALEPIFSADRTVVDMGEFPAISVGPISTPIGSDTITITKKAGGTGTFDSASGAMEVPIILRFDHSLPNFFVGDSDLPLVLTTGTATSPTGAFTLTGAPLDRTTSVVTLVGASAFVGGFLRNIDCGVTITGTVLPSPFVTEPPQGY